MALTITQKLRIKEGMRLLTINAPPDFIKHLEPLPAKVQVSSKLNGHQQVHWFVKSKSEMEKGLRKILDLLNGEVICWIYYPKGSSRIQTDLTRDKGWENLLKNPGLQWISLISFDDTWSSFAMRLKSAADQKKESKAGERVIFQYIDALSKTVHLPEDLAKALKSNKKATEFYNTLSFTNKKEYLEWIISAKKQETRDTRIKACIEKLEKKWKNPRNL